MMSDKIEVGTVPGGKRFFSVERNGRKLPVLNGDGEVEFWPKFGGPAKTEKDFGRVLRALDNADKMKIVNPAPSGVGPEGLYPYQRDTAMMMGIDPAAPGTDKTVTWRMP